MQRTKRTACPAGAAELPGRAAGFGDLSTAEATIRIPYAVTARKRGGAEQCGGGALTSAQTPHIDKLLYRVPEAAESLGVGRTTVYELLRSGQLESVRIGSVVRIPRASLLAFVERLEGRDA